MTTSNADLDRLRYPVGRFTPPTSVTPADRERWIGEIAALPAQLRAAVEGMSEAQLDTPYREGGWTVRQVPSGRPSGPTVEAASDVLLDAASGRVNPVAADCLVQRRPNCSSGSLSRPEDLTLSSSTAAPC